MIHSSALYMLANIDERINDKILIQYYNTTCVIYDLKNADYRSVLTLFLDSWSVLVCRMFSGSKFQKTQSQTQRFGKSLSQKSPSN